MVEGTVFSLTTSGGNDSRFIVVKFVQCLIECMQGFVMEENTLGQKNELGDCLKGTKDFFGDSTCNHSW